MRRIRFISLAWLPFVLAACGTTAPLLQSAPPRQVGAPGYALATHSPRLEATNHTTGHLNSDKTILYFQNYGGGGAGLGLLLGPLGVAANVSMIDSNTKKDIGLLGGKIDINPGVLLTAAAQSSGVVLSDSVGGKAASVTPYLYVSRVDEGQLQLAAAMLVAHGTGAGQWNGKYMYQLPQRFSAQELANLSVESLAQLKAEAQKGYGALLSQIRSERQERQSLEQKVFFKSDLLSPRNDLQMLGSLISDEGSMVWLRTLDGVYGIHKSKVWFEIQKS